MKKTQSELKKLQSYELEILCEFHRICHENNLRYILDFGTLLGAIRHKGFIPWDDDIDVAMPRKDFEIFEKLATKSLPENMFLQTNQSDKNYYSTLPKIRLNNNKYVEESFQHFDIQHGPWIDIFVYDFQYDNINIQNKQILLYNKKRKFISLITPIIYSEDSPNQYFIKTLVNKETYFSFKIFTIQK